MKKKTAGSFVSRRKGRRILPLKKLLQGCLPCVTRNLFASNAAFSIVGVGSRFRLIRFIDLYPAWCYVQSEVPNAQLTCQRSFMVDFRGGMPGTARGMKRKERCLRGGSKLTERGHSFTYNWIIGWDEVVVNICGQTLG